MNKKISKLSQCLVPRDHDEIKFKDKCTESNRTTRSLYADEFFAKCWWEKQSRTDVNTWIVHETDHENMRRTLECLDCSKQVIFLATNEPGTWSGGKWSCMCTHTCIDFEYTCLFAYFCDVTVTTTRRKSLPFVTLVDWQLFLIFFLISIMFKCISI